MILSKFTYSTAQGSIDENCHFNLITASERTRNRQDPISSDTNQANTQQITELYIFDLDRARHQEPNRTVDVTSAATEKGLFGEIAGIVDVMRATRRSYRCRSGYRAVGTHTHTRKMPRENVVTHTHKNRTTKKNERISWFLLWLAGERERAHHVCV